jgi:hypothetical protein
MAYVNLPEQSKMPLEDIKKVPKVLTVPQPRPHPQRIRLDVPNTRCWESVPTL